MARISFLTALSVVLLALATFDLGQGYRLRTRQEPSERDLQGADIVIGAVEDIGDLVFGALNSTVLEPSDEDPEPAEIGSFFADLFGFVADLFTGISSLFTETVETEPEGGFFGLLLGEDNETESEVETEEEEESSGLLEFLFGDEDNETDGGILDFLSGLGEDDNETDTEANADGDDGDSGGFIKEVLEFFFGEW